MTFLVHALKFHLIPADHAGDRDILVVAFRLSRTWLARMSVVAGKSEWQRVIQSGRNVRERLARSLFPEFQEVAYESPWLTTAQNSRPDPVTAISPGIR